MYKGNAVSLNAMANGLVELVLDLQGSSVNKLNSIAVAELLEAVSILAKDDQVSGLLISSAKPAFVVGADVTEFPEILEGPADGVRAWLGQGVSLFDEIESLPFPTVAAVNGLALGGGLELALAADLRVMADDARVGLPEVNLGICPGWGGTVRLARLAGIEIAAAWATTGKPQPAAAALSAGVVSQVVASGSLRDSAVKLLEQAVSGEVAYMESRKRKQAPSETLTTEQAQGLREIYGKQFDANYPAAGAILELILGQAGQTGHAPFAAETDTFIELASGDAAKSLIGIFLNDQFLRAKAKNLTKIATPVRRSAVLGAGIMGGGIAFQSAVTGTPVLMKDINQEALDLGVRTADGILEKQVARKKLDQEGKARVLAAITPTLEYDGFDEVDYVVEAVVENPRIKGFVLAEVEKVLPPHAVVTSNTSTIRINLLAESLERPEQFCGMHFFNPVHLMPLVEIIRGEKTSESTVATAVAFASAMGKFPVVVNDCPGFLVNRILFPYFNGFNRLLKDGVSFERIDQVMQNFGWPMGPAYLTDVIGIDTLVHCDEVMEEGFPDRMTREGKTVIEALQEAGMLGQKSGEGFYVYSKDDQGKPVKTPSLRAQAVIDELSGPAIEMADEDIIDRLMVPMCLEASRCLEDGVVETAAEVDTGLLLGLGFPRFRGGALRYMDAVGLAAFGEKAKGLSHLGSLYQLTEGLKKRITFGERFY